MFLSTKILHPEIDTKIYGKLESFSYILSMWSITAFSRKKQLYQTLSFAH